MKKFLLVLSTVFIASCATVPRGDENEIRMCSSSPVETLFKFFQGITDIFSPSGRDQIRAMTKEGSITGAFGKGGNEDLGMQVIRQIAADPKFVEKGGSCTCTPHSITDTADPEKKIALVDRIVADDDATRYYQRTFSVRFDLRGNCIRNGGIESIDDKWIFIKEERAY